MLTVCVVRVDSLCFECLADAAGSCVLLSMTVCMYVCVFVCLALLLRVTVCGLAT